MVGNARAFSMTNRNPSIYSLTVDSLKAPAASMGISLPLFLPFFLGAPARFTLLWMALVLAIAVGIYALAGERRRNWCGFRPVGRLWGLLAAAVAVDLVLEMSTLILWLKWAGPPAPQENSLAPYMNNPEGWLSLVVLMGIIVPIVEEVAFRGFLQRRMSERVSPTTAVVVTAFLFTLIHFNIWGMVSLFVGGLALGYVAYSAGTVWASIVLHGGWNVFLLFMEGANIERADLLAVPAALPAAAFVAAGIVYVWLCRKMQAVRSGSEPSQRPERIVSARVAVVPLPALPEAAHPHSELRPAEPALTPR